MRNYSGLIGAAVLVAACLAAAGCRNIEQLDLTADGGGDTDTHPDTDTYPTGFGGLDLLIVVDNSGSMAEEQELMASAIFPLINAFTNPLPDWQFGAVDDVRVAVVSSDMGLSWGGNPYTDGDGWPGTPPCTESGDDGKFETYAPGKLIHLADNQIPCDESAAQCPTDWACEDIDDETGIGTCDDPTGGGLNQSCPLLDGPWPETAAAQANPILAFQVACLSTLGTNGCGFEQQLASAARGLERDDQADFIRDGNLLAVLVISDEEDCSIEDNELFMTAEIQDLGDGKVNVACGNHPDYLYPPGAHYTRFLAAKGGNPNAVVFAAIVGVPMDDACQGQGNNIPSCLDHEDMEENQVAEGDPPAYFFAPACTRSVGDTEVTKARPGRRFVQLAQLFGHQAYVYSICNSDWEPAMRGIAQIATEVLQK